MNTECTNIARDTSKRNRTADEVERMIRTAARRMIVNLDDAPTPLSVHDLVSACELTDCLVSDVLEYAEDLMRDGPLPEFGMIRIERPTMTLGGCLGHNLMETLDDLTDLRELAADAIRAAEWLEARR